MRAEIIRTREYELVPPFLGKVEYVFWDMDGTLIPDEKQLHQMIFDQAAGLVADAKKIGWNEAWWRLKAVYEDKGSMSKSLAQWGLPGRRFMQEIWQELPLEDYVKYDPQVCQMIAAFQSQGYRMGLITNANRRVDAIRKLELVGLNYRDFNPLVCTGDMEWDKPDPRVFEYALKSAGACAQQVVFVGDSERRDIMGALGAGIPWTIKIGEPSVKASVSVPDRYAVGQLFEIEV